MHFRRLWLVLDGLLVVAIVALLAARVSRLNSSCTVWPSTATATDPISYREPAAVVVQPRSVARALHVSFEPTAHATGVRDSLGEVLEQSWEGLPAYPAMDMADLGSEFLLTFCLTGFEQADVHVRMQGSVLTVLAERNDASLERTQRLQRRVQLPEAVAPGTVPLAYWTNGLLRVRVRKTGIQNS